MKNAVAGPERCNVTSGKENAHARAKTTALRKKVDSFTAEVTLSHAGKVFDTARRVIAKDAKTMTITFERRDQADGLVKNVQVYERQ